MSVIDILGFEVFFNVHGSLLEVWSDCIEIYTDGFLKNAGLAEVVGGMTVYFPAVERSVGYSQQLELNNNYFSAESAFNFYVNDKITDCLGGTVNIKSARENFYTELFQHINLPKNYSFALIIREINQTIKRYTQQQFPITYADKGKERLQTPVVTPKKIQPPTWKKIRVESPTNPSYYYMPRSAINIFSADASTLNMTSTFG
ncbi:hypothetical protein G9A89_004783 [Geosiphon pyriformis]|nr:hypothetical protein G9A89_004783 [Geosiphon pyriformis]